MSGASNLCAKVAHLHHLQHQSTSPMASCKTPTSLPGIEFLFFWVSVYMSAPSFLDFWGL